jgi:hypothetical protein
MPTGTFPQGCEGQGFQRGTNPQDWVPLVEAAIAAMAIRFGDQYFPATAVEKSCLLLLSPFAEARTLFEQKFGKGRSVRQMAKEQSNQDLYPNDSWHQVLAKLGATSPATLSVPDMLQ